MDPNAHKKARLVNRMNTEQLLKKLESETFQRITLSFYRYVILQNPEQMRDILFEMWSRLDCLGRIYVAREGINAQMNVPEHHFNQFKEELYAIPEFENIPFKIAVEHDPKSFLKLTVKVRKKIVADGLNDDEYDVTNVGRHLSAREWNQMMDLPNVKIVDMRNFYESEIGHFEGALLPQAETFREELPEVLNMLKGNEENPVLLYCTGGIRCEKASAYLRHHGFKNVNQLHGGIIDYYRQVKEEGLENRFRGKNFVFDNRLGEHISQDIISACHQCGKPCDTHRNCANKACNILFIQCDDCARLYENTCSPTCQQIIHLPEDEQKKYLRKVKQQKKFMRYRRWKKECS
ncbi:MAG: rhodanese-related sulfurtransferase [Thermaurantimonas sp.]